MAGITLKIKNIEKNFTTISELKEFIEFVEVAAAQSKTMSNEQIIKILEKKYKTIPTYKAKNVEEIFSKAGI
jgi:predicted transcriptional regulator